MIIESLPSEDLKAIVYTEKGFLSIDYERILKVRAINGVYLKCFILN